MKLKSFNKQKNNKKAILIISSIFFVGALILVITSYSLYQKVDDKVFVNGTVSSFGNGDIILSILVDGESVDEIPSKNRIYNVNVDCGTDATGEWDYYKWGANISDINVKKVTCNVIFNTLTQYYFEYKGSEDQFKVPQSGNYKIELWGAQGGETTGYGAYVSGDIYLSKDTILYIYVGEHPLTDAGGWNGGGNGKEGNTLSSTNNLTAGGGSTDIRILNNPTTNDLKWNSTIGLRSRIMVAAGGGGVSFGGAGAAGGGIYGYDGIPKNLVDLAMGYGATQTTGGEAGTFNWHDTAPTDGGFGTGGSGNTSYGGGAGSGYYGGGGSGVFASSYGGSGSGSSYISGHTGCLAINSSTDETPKSGCSNHTDDNSCSIHYSGYKFTNTKMIDGYGYIWTNTKGLLEQMPNPEGGYYYYGIGNSGDGRVRITYLGN